MALRALNPDRLLSPTLLQITPEAGERNVRAFYKGVVVLKSRVLARQNGDSFGKIIAGRSKASRITDCLVSIRREA